ncbi:helix-turn-helix domain-containing protein [Salinactinospora qingdaonensis]|uniref:HTH cro/C1-type domain-containing protein n=1 Tax=Salinactinospora qingdaonensis TaxID=702744 RepID=A0ABP7GHY5_9ACTN
MERTREEGQAKGDIGRRVEQRRLELQLSREELAEQAGMAPGYVAYLEEHPPLLSRWALYRLAAALRTSPDQLLGAETEAPAGSAATAVPSPELLTLTSQQCLDLIAPGGVGRVAFVIEGESAPTVLPVNYVVREAAIVFRTAAHGVIAKHAPGPVSFQVDRLDGAMSEGWSVLVAGHAQRVEEASETAALRGVAPVRPWAGGERDTYMRITPVELSGRRIRNRGHPHEAPPPSG